MKILPFVIVIVLLFVNPAVQGQDNRLPACSTAQLSQAESMQGEFDPLIFTAATIENLGDLLSFSTAQLAWRAEMWAHLPLCDDVFTLGLMLDQLSEALFMRLSLDSAGVAADDNPYSELGIQSAQEINGLNELFRAANADDSAADAAAGPLRACSGDERLLFSGDIWTGIVNLLNTAYAVDTSTALLDYVHLKLAWRAEIWPQLPPCKEAYEIATWMYRYSSDMTKIYMLDLFGVERAENPYDDTYLEGLIQYSEYAQWVETAGTDYKSLPSCADTTIGAALYDSFERHHDWTEVPHGAVEELPEVAKAHIEWRESLWAALPGLPACREAFETALLTLQITGDAAAVTALATSGIGLLELGFAYQERVVGAGNRIGELNQALQVEQNAEDASPNVALAKCSDKELDILFDDLQGFIALRERAQEMRAAEDLIAYIQALFEWRDLLWTALPGCAEAFDIAAMMIQAAGDYGGAGCIGPGGRSRGRESLSSAVGARHRQDISLACRGLDPD